MPSTAQRPTILTARDIRRYVRKMIEPRMDVQNVAEAVVFMATRTLDANVMFLNVMATKMPFVGRG